jgi:hypothetical protein
MPMPIASEGRSIAYPGSGVVRVLDEVDVLVCGGGVAGIAAAVAAARSGVRTLVVERAGYLGGTATGSLMSLITTPFAELTGFPAEFLGYLSDRGSAGRGRVVPWDVEAYKFAAEEFVLKAGAEILYHTWISDTVLEGDGLKAVIVENKSGRQAIVAKVVIDATGDADIAARAGVPFVKGREEDGAMRPATVLGLVGNVDLRRMKAWIDAHLADVASDPGRCIVDLAAGILRIDGFFSIVEEAKRRGLLAADVPVNYLRFSASFEPGQEEHALVTINSTRIYDLDGTDARQISRAETEGRRQLQQLMTVCKVLLPGFENSLLVQSSNFVGVRETRRIRGQYVLTYADISEGRQFEDSVAVITHTNYGTAEIHGPERGHEGSKDDRWAREMVLDLIHFEFPLRSMLMDQCSNLIVAGRSVSVTHDADKYTRSMGPAGQLGQVAGTYAGLLARRGFANRNSLVPTLQERLEAGGLVTKLRPGAATK